MSRIYLKILDTLDSKKKKELRGCKDGSVVKNVCFQRTQVQFLEPMWLLTT